MGELRLMRATLSLSLISLQTLALNWTLGRTLSSHSSRVLLLPCHIPALQEQFGDFHRLSLPLPNPYIRPFDTPKKKKTKNLLLLDPEPPLHSRRRRTGHPTQRRRSHPTPLILTRKITCPHHLPQPSHLHKRPEIEPHPRLHADGENTVETRREFVIRRLLEEQHHVAVAGARVGLRPDVRRRRRSSSSSSSSRTVVVVVVGGGGGGVQHVFARFGADAQFGLVPV